MGRECCVDGCDIRTNLGHSFHIFPTGRMRIDQFRRKLWIEAVFGAGDNGRVLNKSLSICGRHFVSGKPAKFNETSAANWVPTLHLGDGKEAPKVDICKVLPINEEGIPQPVQVLFKEQSVLQVMRARSDEVNPFEVDLTTLKNEEPDLEEVIEVKPDVEEAISLSGDDSDEAESTTGEDQLMNEEQCLFCLNKLRDNEKAPMDFNQEETFKNQVAYVLAKRVDFPSYPCCKNCKQMFAVSYQFKKSCMLALSKPRELLSSITKKRPAAQNIAPAAKKKTETITVDLHAEELEPIESEYSAEQSEEEELDQRKHRESLRCRVCGEMFAGSFELTFHKQKCVPPKEPLKCQHCPATFRKGWDLQLHLNRHNGVKPYQCRKESCTKEFSSPITRIMHEKKCNNESEKVICPVCGVTFKCDVYMRRHMFCHEAPKYECAVCHRKFYDITTFRGHSMRHFEREEKPAENEDEPDEPLDHVCDSCSQAFAREELLNGHKVYCNRNSKFRKFQLLCPLCPESFNKQETLDQHLNRHKGIKSIPCRKEGCTKMFFDTPGRNVHELYRCGRDGGTHVCPICETALGTPTALRIHMKSHK